MPSQHIKAKRAQQCTPNYNTNEYDECDGPSTTYDLGHFDKDREQQVGHFVAEINKFEGQGKLYCQTHNMSAFGRILGPKLKPR